MLAQKLRLTTKDVRYIQKQRNTIWTNYFGFSRIPQYSNRKFHQISVYIAADRVKKSARRHQLKRQILEIVHPRPQGSGPYYKVFVFLNKKTVDCDLIAGDKAKRDQGIELLCAQFSRDWNFAQTKLGKIRKGVK